MVLSYGEILADLIGKKQSGVVSYDRFAGGAPFNVACACKRAGGNSGFVGAVGDDIVGKFLVDFANGQALNLVDLAVLPGRNTTLAFVELDANGERSFCFYRKNTADYRLQTESLQLVEKADIVHLGSLMLSEKEGVEFADTLVERVKKAGKKLSFDINYRDDIFPNPTEAKRIYEKYAKVADIVKYSEEELALFTGKPALEGLAEVAEQGKLICVTLGKNGCAYAIGERVGFVPSVEVKPVDTTGAGDAFFGALLSKLDGKDFAAFTNDELYRVFRFANVAGALATTNRGAIDSLPTEAEIMRLI